MSRSFWLLAAAALLVHAREVAAQGCPPPGRVTFQLTSGRLKVVGSWSTGPAIYLVPAGSGSPLLLPPGFGPPVYGVIERRIIIERFVPVRAGRSLAPDYDLSGIDLDVEPVERLFPPGALPASKPPGTLPPPQPLRSPAPKKDVAKRLPPPSAKPSVSTAKKPPIDELLVPRAGAAEESRRLAELGLRAFRAGEYGIAARRFRQAVDQDPAHARACFLLAQAYLAVGQLRDAAAAVEQGLRLDPDWPARAFNPAEDLYGEAPDDWRSHRKRLDAAVAREPQALAYRFLRAYAAWFDGRRALAAQWFREARPSAADPRWIDLFLKHAPDLPVARR